MYLAQQRQGHARDSCESGFENVIDITSQDIVLSFSLFGPFAMRNIVRGVKNAHTISVRVTSIYVYAKSIN